MKINFDGSVRNGNGIIRYIISNYAGITIAVWVIKLGEVSVFITEVIILRNGVKSVYKLGYRR